MTSFDPDSYEGLSLGAPRFLPRRNQGWSVPACLAQLLGDRRPVPPSTIQGSYKECSCLAAEPMAEPCHDSNQPERHHDKSDRFNHGVTVALAR